MKGAIKTNLSRRYKLQRIEEKNGIRKQKYSVIPKKMRGQKRGLEKCNKMQKEGAKTIQIF